MEKEKQEEVEIDLLGHLDVKVRAAFAHEEVEPGGNIRRDAKGDFLIASDAWHLAPDSRNPEWREHKFGLLTLRDGSVMWDEEEGAYTIELIPARKRKVEVVLEDEETGEFYPGFRWERTITVIATQVIPDFVIGAPTEQRDSGNVSKLMRQRAAKAAKLAAKAEKEKSKTPRRKGRVVSGSLVTGSLVQQMIDGKPCLFRIGSGSPTAEAVFDATPDGFKARNV